MGHGFLDKVAKSATAPWEMLKASDPLTQFITGNKVDFNPDHNLDAALGEAYDGDPVGNSLLTKDDYKRTGKVAAAAAAAFFAAPAAASALGGSSAGGVATTAGAGLGAPGSLAAGTGAASTTTAATATASGVSTGLSILKQVGPAVVSSLLSKQSGGSTDAPDAPEITAPVAMPTPNSMDVTKARKKSLIQQMQRRGRASTILTGNSEKLGG